MHRTTTVASVLAGLILVSGCSGASDTDTSQVAGFVVADVGTDSQPAGRTTPLAGLSPLEVWEKTKPTPTPARACRSPPGSWTAPSST